MEHVFERLHDWDASSFSYEGGFCVEGRAQGALRGFAEVIVRIYLVGLAVVAHVNLHEDAGWTMSFQVSLGLLHDRGRVLVGNEPERQLQQGLSPHWQQSSLPR